MTSLTLNEMAMCKWVLQTKISRPLYKLTVTDSQTEAFALPKMEVLIAFVYGSNIKSVSHPILTKLLEAWTYLDPICVWPKFWWVTNFLNPKNLIRTGQILGQDKIFCRSKLFLDPTLLELFFFTKHFNDPKYFEHNIFWVQSFLYPIFFNKYFLDQIYFGPKFCLHPKEL